jgi:hypothetical protein
MKSKVGSFTRMIELISLLILSSKLTNKIEENKLAILAVRVSDNHYRLL